MMTRTNDDQSRSSTRLWWLLVLPLVLALSACGPRGPGMVSGQVKYLSADGSVRNIAGAQLILRGAQDTKATTSTAGEGSEPDASYNYRFEQVQPGRYVMSVTPPQGSGLQGEDELVLDVKAGETYPQSVLLLPEGMAKPRPLRPDEVAAGESGYVNGQGQRVVYNSGGGFNTSDALLMYLLFRNPVGYGYGAPPVIVSSPGSGYRVDPPPTRTSSGQTVTQRPPSVPGQGATRPGSAPASGPSTSSGASSGSSSSGSSSSPSQGASRPSAPSAPSAPSRSSGGSSSGGRSSGGSSGGRK